LNLDHAIETIIPGSNLTETLRFCQKEQATDSLRKISETISMWNKLSYAVYFFYQS